jgi:hydrogenase maturation protease
MRPAPTPLLVLGLGNVLCGDDGVGVLAVRMLAERFEIPPGLRVLDGGTLGLGLLGHFDDAEEVLLVDAVRADAPPGTLVELAGEDVPPAVRDRLSVHQVGVADLLDALRLLGSYPRRLRLLGLVPGTLELGLARSPAVERALPALLDAVVERIGAAGHALVPREVDASALDDPGARSVARALGL